MSQDLRLLARIGPLTADNRRRFADVLEGLDAHQWQADTLCEAWDVHHLAAHQLQPMLIGFGRFFWTSLRHRGDTDRTIEDITRRLARHTPEELIDLLRRHADDRVSPPRVGPMGPFADTCIHLRDLARPLGLDADVPREHWHLLLDYLTGPDAAPSLVVRGRLDGLRLRATDLDWQSGDGRELTGPAEALGMAVTGRLVALQDLRGPGVEILRRRATGHGART